MHSLQHDPVDNVKILTEHIFKRVTPRPLLHTAYRPISTLRTAYHNFLASRTAYRLTKKTTIIFGISIYIKKSHDSMLNAPVQYFYKR